jgi:ATP-binding cassette subfamily F protein 3
MSGFNFGKQMLVNIDIKLKTLGTKKLFQGLNCTIQAGEKIGLIGRNGVGKTTLFRVLTGEDEFEGDVTKRRGTTMVMTAQEHTEHHHESCLAYILGSLPEYTQLSEIIETYPETMGSDMTKIGVYSDALQQFGELGYHDIENKVLVALEKYQIPEALARGPLHALSGGQKRFVELVKVTQSSAELALIDEPTNHMDYIAKDAFIDWLKSSTRTVVVITHDRDVLKYVDRIFELKDHKMAIFQGNYDAYLQQNSVSTVTQIGQYEVAQRTIENLKKQIQYAKSKKSAWGGTADKKNPFVVMEEKARKQLKELEATVGRPSFWIDQESVEQLDNKVTESYQRYKTRNIRLSGLSATQHDKRLLEVRDVSLGYDGKPLFSGVSFDLRSGERIQIRGRNGAGKTTLINTLRATMGDGVSAATVFGGEVKSDPKLRLGVYEQEIEAHFMKKPLGEAIIEVYRAHDIAVNDQKVRQVLADYLFDPTLDVKLPIGRLSGGQKARFQIISMLAHQPNLLILDEPTNHLDLPSIEELEKALQNYNGAILYVSHDSYFVEKLGGEVVQIGRT